MLVMVGERGKNSENSDALAAFVAAGRLLPLSGCELEFPFQSLAQISTVFPPSETLSVPPPRFSPSAASTHSLVVIKNGVVPPTH